MNASSLPAYLQNRPSRGLAQSLVANLGVGSPPYLSIMGNRLTLVDAVGEEIPVATYDPKTGPYLDCVVIDALERTSKVFYDKAYDPSASQYEPPPCWSDNGVGPSRNAAVPQSPTCAACPQGAWGSKVSAVSGKGVKACADIQKIALLVPGYEMPFLMRIPPNSRTNFRGYVNKFVGQAMDISDVTTRIAFEQGTIGTLVFAAVGWLDEATVVPQRDKLMAAKATDAIVGRTDLPREGMLAAPAAQPALAAPQAEVGQAQASQTAGYVPPGPTAAQVPFVAPPATQPSPTAFTGQPAATAQPAAQSPQSEPQRRRRRTAAEMQAAQAPQNGAAPAAQPQQAPFMPGAAAPQPNFGIQAGAAPNAELAATLDNLFGPRK